MKYRILLAGAAAFGACAMISAAADAASFNCGAAKTPTEHAICDNPQLSTLDDQTSGLYYTIVGARPPQATLSQVKSQQASFIAQRNSCGANFNCLVDAYTSQIMYLRQTKEQLGL